MMTREAKTGLLLGLIFIIAISIVLKDVNQNRLPTDEEFGQPIPEAPSGLDDILAAVGQLHPGEFKAERPESVDGLRAHPTESVKVDFPVDQTEETGVVVPPSAPKATAYKVKQGDDLSRIAFVVYGPVEGNRWVNVTRIFNANRDVLPSMDVVQIGQMLQIPPLPSLGIVITQTIQTQSPLDLVAKQLSNASSEKVSRKKSPRPTRFYRVKAGDSLWRIAQNTLGDGSRYREILRLNKGKIDYEDDVSVNMQLRLPAE